MRKSYITWLGILAFGMTACNISTSDQTPPAPAKNAVETTDANPEKKPVDMKALFGEDYQPGDIGHAFGIINSASSDNAKITIEHGPIHGTPIEPAITQLDMLADTDISGLSVGDNVEFLVRKGDDGSYRVFQICKMKHEGEKCL